MILIFAVNIVIVTLAVMIHYEILAQLAQRIPNIRAGHRQRLCAGVFGALMAHVVEVWLFGIAYYFMHHDAGWGTLVGNFNGTLLDCIYFSFSTYTTLGFGDIEPLGELRYLTGIEALTGLVLITWTASFLYIEMQRFWESD